MTDAAISLPETQHPRDRWLYAILLLALAFRTYHLAYPFWDYFASRQTFNLMVAREFTRGNLDLTRPQVAWLVADQTDRPSYFLGEFPLIHALAAGIWRVLPLGDWCARLVVIALSLAGLLWLYSLTYRLLGRDAARFAALAWGVLPFSVFFGRAFMSDIPALSLSVGSLDAFVCWLESRSRLQLLLAGALGALALLTKPTVIGFGLPMIFLAALEFRWKLPTQPRLYLLGFGIVFPAYLWLGHVQQLARAGGPEVIGLGLVGHSLGLWLTSATWHEQLERLMHMTLGPLGLGLVVLGLLWPGAKGREWIFHVWLAGNVLVLFLIPEAFAGWNDYYLLLLIPPAAGLIGRGLAECYRAAQGRRAAVALAGLLVLLSPLTTLNLHRSDGLHFRLGTVLSRLTRPGDLIVTASGSAADLLYFANRRGWEARTFQPAQIERHATAGARVFATGNPDAALENRHLWEFLDRRFVRLSGESSPWMIWALDSPPATLRDLPTGEIRNPYPVNYGNQIEMLGNSIRELLVWPTSFEVTYYWQCLRSVDRDLMVFVHFTTPEGKIVFQQDHWPAQRHLPTMNWKVGDIIRERYVVVAPENAAPGHYQVRVGWYDPESGDRLPILSPGASDGEDRARVAEFEVRRAPRYGWFSVEE